MSGLPPPGVAAPGLNVKHTVAWGWGMPLPGTCQSAEQGGAPSVAVCLGFSCRTVRPCITGK